MDVTAGAARRVLDKLEIEPVVEEGLYGGFLVVDGVRVLKVHYDPRISGTVSETVMQLFRKSLRLSTGEFAALVECTLNRQKFVAILRQRGDVGSTGGLDGW